MTKRFLILLTVLTASMLAFHSTAAAEIAPSADATKPLKAGAKAPEAAFKDAEGKVQTLQDILKAGPVVLVYYRGGWCPFCNRHLQGLSEAAPELEKLGLRIIAVAPDLPAKLQETAKKDELKYTLLSDATMKGAEAFGIAFKVDDATLTKYKGYGIDLETSSGEKHHALPVPSVFIIDKDGSIRFAYSEPDYKVRLSNEDLLKAAKETKSN